MEYILIIQSIIIILLIAILVSKNKKKKAETSLMDVYDGKEERITYSWKLDSARKTKLKGHLVLHFNLKELSEQRLNNPFAITPHHDTESNLRDMYYYMLNHPRTLLHAIEVVKYINRECSRNNVGELDKLQFVLDFVQEPNIRYNYDHDCAEIQHSKEYIRFPDETLYDRNGDCDCKSFLATILFHLMGYNVLFIISYKLGHAAICIEYDQRWQALLQNDKEDVTTEIDGRKYVYCETTSDHFRIGGISSDFTINDVETRIEFRG